MKKNNINTDFKYYQEIKSTYSKLTSLSLADFEKEKTALIIIDMVNGFVKQGPLSSPYVLGINDKIAQLAKRCCNVGIPVICFADCHSEQSAEFSSYPLHCLKDSEESKVTDEIAESGEYILIEKNSTNGFLQSKFNKFIKENEKITNFISVGCCTDICVMQFCLNLKTYFNNINKQCDVIVPTALTETYDAPYHNREFWNTAAYENMKLNGIKIVDNIIT